MSRETEIGAGLIDELLDLPTGERRTEFLRSENLLTAEGLDRLLDAADHLLGSDPGKARRLAELCRDLAEAADAPAAVPRANYVLAGAHNINGEFEEDLRLTQAAHDGYISLGMNLEALRTNVGKMAALLELGRYREALDVGRIVLDALEGKSGFDARPTKEQFDLLTALVQQNRGGCYEYMGLYDEALDAYSIAEEHYKELEMTERLGEIADNRGAILLSLGRGSEALAAHESAVEVFSASELTLPHAKALINFGEAHLRLGNYKFSLDAFAEVRQPLELLNALADKYLLLRHTADAYLELNLYAEALANYREAVDLLRDSGMAHDHAQALWGMGSALIARSEFEEAESALSETAKLFAAAGNTPLLSGVMLEQAALLEARGHRDAARKKAEESLELVSGSDWPVQIVYAHLRLADLMPNLEQSELHLREARRMSEKLSLPQLRHRLNERMGRVRRLQGRDEEARELLETAIDEIERLRGTVTQDAMRSSFLKDKTVAYEELMRLHLEHDDEESIRLAFSVAERAKSRALVDLLTGVAEPGTSSNGDSELDERIRAMQADLNAVYNRMLGAGDDEDGAPDLGERAAELEEGISRLRFQAAATSADPFAAPPTTEDSLSRLPSNVAMLAYHTVGDEILAFVIYDGDVKVARSVGSVEKARSLLRKMDSQWDRFRAGAGFAGRHLETLERSARRVLSALYDELVKPVESLLEEAATLSGEDGSSPKLVVVPHGPLHQTPFHALFDGERYFFERFEVSYAPSAAVFAICREREALDADRAIALGVEDASIPAAKSEAFSVARRFPDSEVLVDERATISSLEEATPGRGVVHLACHGLFRSDNPMFSALKLHDGWLTAADAMKLDLSGATVALSACESGRGEVVGGDEVLGLTRAFLGAGAATVVVSLWLAQDETTAEMMEVFYEKLRGGMSPASALDTARRKMKEKYPHPYYWAPFILVGKR
jgi:tetratricopeptide (TPR) repeat protein